MPQDRSTATILHIEDDPVTQELIRKAFDRLEAPPHLVQVGTADEARTLLGEREIGPPLVLLVDLGVPGMYGGDFLAALREDPRLSGTPVFILSASDDPEHIRSAYGYQAAGYIVKPTEPKETMRVVEMLATYADVVTLPPGR